METNHVFFDTAGDVNTAAASSNGRWMCPSVLSEMLDEKYHVTQHNLMQSSARLTNKDNEPETQWRKQSFYLKHVFTLVFFFFLSFFLSTVCHQKNRKVVQWVLRQLLSNYLTDLFLDLFLSFHTLHKSISKCRILHAVTIMSFCFARLQQMTKNRLSTSVFGFAPEELIMLLSLHNSKHCVLMARTGMIACWNIVWVFSFVLTAFCLSSKA